LCVIQSRKYICFYGGLQFHDLNAQKLPATMGLQPFKSQYFKGKTYDMEMLLGYDSWWHFHPTSTTQHFN
jgi:hypothetical protein